MKKVLFAAVAVLALASCKKDWTCECNIPGMSEPTTRKIEKKSKKDAEADCEGKISAGIISVSTENYCKLK